MNAANKYCKNLDNIKFIGITGTNGKSTTAIILKNILSDFGYKVGLIGTGKIIFENEILSDETLKTWACVWLITSSAVVNVTPLSTTTA